MKKFKIIRDEYNDIAKYVLTENIYITREVATNFTKTSSKYYLYKDGKLVKESGIGTGYSLQDLKRIALQLV